MESLVNKLTSLILTIMLLSSSVFGKDVVAVKKGAISPSDGYFVSNSQMARFIELNEENKILKKQVITLKDLALNHESQITFYKKRVTHLESELTWQQTKGIFKTTGAFFIGVLATSAAAYAAIQVSGK